MTSIFVRLSVHPSRRLIKSIVPIGLISFFALLLTFILYNKPTSPGKRLGWQSWEIVSYDDSYNTVAPPPPSDLPETNTTHPKEWWETAEAVGMPTTSLPLDVWAPLLPHHTGLTEITLMPCIFFPAFVDVCNPKSTPEEDALKGKWVRVERDLNKKTGIWYLNLWYRRSRRLDVPLITSLKLLEDGQQDLLSEPKSSWYKVKSSMRHGVYPSQTPLYLWYKLRPPLQDATDDEEIEEAITEIDVLYGEDRPWYGFEKMDRPVVNSKEGVIDSVWVTYRKGVKPIPRPEPLHFSHSGSFTILQIADLHYSVSQGKCRDTDLFPCRHGDAKTDSLLARVLDAENPDLVVFSGDQLNGQGTSWDSKSVLAKFAGTVIDRNISWAVILGNHDSQDDLSRAAQMQLLQSMPYSFATAGPTNVPGVGNYVLKVHSADPSMTHLLTLYFLDSGAYAPTPWGFWQSKDYDWIKPEQTKWFLTESNKVQPIERPFTPDGTSDLGHIWTKDEDEIEERQSDEKNKTLAKPNAMLFHHIPLPEAYDAPDIDIQSNKALDVGLQLDGKGSPKHNSGFFSKGILRAKESETGGREVKVIGNGHSHVSENCKRVKGVWLCFGGGGSYSGYGRVGFDRRFRIYKVEDYGESIRTYKRTEHGVIVDSMVLVGRGGPAAYDGARRVT